LRSQPTEKAGTAGARAFVHRRLLLEVLSAEYRGVRAIIDGCLGVDER